MRPGTAFHDISSSTSNQAGYLPLREAAKWAGVSPKTMTRWFERGLPRYQVGTRGKVLVRREDLDVFIQNKSTVKLEA